MLWSIFGMLSSRVWTYIAGSLVILALAGMIYFKGRQDCYAKYRYAELQVKLAAAENALKLLREDAKQGRIDQKYLSDLEKSYEKLEDTIIDGDCFTQDESDRVLEWFPASLWNYFTPNPERHRKVRKETGKEAGVDQDEKGGTALDISPSEIGTGEDALRKAVDQAIQREQDLHR